MDDVSVDLQAFQIIIAFLAARVPELAGFGDISDNNQDRPRAPTTTASQVVNALKDGYGPLGCNIIRNMTAHGRSATPATTGVQQEPPAQRRSEHISTEHRTGRTWELLSASSSLGEDISAGRCQSLVGCSRRRHGRPTGLHDKVPLLV